MNLIKQFVRKAKGVKLTPEEQSRTDDQLLAFLQSKATPEQQAIFVRRMELDRRIRQRSRLLFRNFFTSKTMPIFLALVLLVTAGGGVSLAAQGALPGETLYPAKIALEEVEARLAFSAEAKSSVETARAQHRLEELETLAAKGTLNSQVKAQIHADFTAQAAQAEKGIATLQTTDQKAAAAVASDFEAALKTHEQIIARIKDEKPTRGENLDLVLGAVREETKAVAEARQGAEAKVSAEANVRVQAAAEGRKISAARKINEAERALARMDERISTSTRATAEARLQAATNEFARGNAELEAGAFNEAFLAFSRAHRLAQEAKLLIKTEAALDGDLDHQTETRTERNNPTTTPGSTTGTSTEDREHTHSEFKLKGKLEDRTKVEIGL